jgi:hypothetical protein
MQDYLTMDKKLLADAVEAALLAPDGEVVATFKRMVAASAEKPRPCPHGRVWLVGDQVCMCRADSAGTDNGT